MEDKRFALAATDPKFRRYPKGERKVKINKRFHSMFKDKKFKVKYTIVSRDRPVNCTSTEDLKRYCDLSSEKSSSEEDDEEKREVGKYVRTPRDSEEEKFGTKIGDLKANDKGVKVSEDVKNKS